MPDPAMADDDLVAVGADLEPATLVDAYRNGIFPWPHGDGPLPWFSPRRRALITHESLHVSRSLRRRLRHSGWETTVDTAFPAVIAACATAERPGEHGTWITPAMQEAYTRVFRLGWAHSFEVWSGDGLVGGLYGVHVGGFFAGESMFRRVADASKAAVVDAVERLHRAGGTALDVQMATDHLRSLGAFEVDRREFLRLLRAHRDDPVHLPRERCPVSRLAE